MALPYRSKIHESQGSKSIVELKDIFNDKDGERRIVFTEGAPGFGTTTIVGIEHKLRRAIDIIAHNKIDERMQEIKKESLDHWYLDEGIRRNRRKRRTLTRLKKMLHQLERECEETLKSIWESESKVQNLEWRLQAHKQHEPQVQQRLHNLRCEFEQKLQKLNCDLKEVYCQLREIKWQRQEFEDLLRIAYVHLESLFVRLVTLFDEVDAAHQDGFRNFLLDGWWLEFWEIILLAAGDVERNPGPRQITGEELAEVSDTPIGK
jgi:flagellar motility protein MotE (MotC chaperone)